MGMACVQWLVPLDMLRYGHVSNLSTGHVGTRTRVRITTCPVELATGHKRHSFSKTITDQYILIITIKNVSMHIYTRILASNNKIMTLILKCL